MSNSSSGHGRRKVKIDYIQDKSRRHITFSKRKAGIMKKAFELATLTGTQILLLVASETGHVYTYATSKMQPMITNGEGKDLIQQCLKGRSTIAPIVPKFPGIDELAMQDPSFLLPPSFGANFPNHPLDLDFFGIDPVQRSASATPQLGGGVQKA